ncbi:uncharacterized protein YcbX [Devosia sp. UYZn731]|uniref:MOSC domain-containing protein n=1 Tax=Devosia sp. UYZn731 TaxID=3156345 RepID=UPI0033993B2F
MAGFEIIGLWIYPIKSLGGVSVHEATITSAGSFVGDREWLVVDQTGRMLWQGDLPKMTLLQVKLLDHTLTISRHDGTSIGVPVTHGGRAAAVTQYGDEFVGVDAGEAVAAWLSEFLDHPCRLVRIGRHAHQRPKLNPLHVVSVHSLRILNQLMEAQGAVTIELERLRPNVVLGGEHEPFAEETASIIGFEGSQLLLTQPCVRCELPNISRVDASRETQPLKLIGKMSKQRPASKPASFGTYVRAVGPWLRTGMLSR